MMVLVQHILQGFLDHLVESSMLAQGQHADFGDEFLADSCADLLPGSR